MWLTESAFSDFTDMTLTSEDTDANDDHNDNGHDNPEDHGEMVKIGWKWMKIGEIG